MRYIYFYFISLLTVAFIPPLNKSILQSKTADDILQKTCEKLSAIQTLKYDYYREINYKSESYKAEYSCTKFLDFQNKDSIIGFTYQLDNDQYKLVYNGKENFILNKKDSSIKINSKSALSDFISLSAFSNSILTLKKAIPSLINDHTIEKILSDTTIENKNYHIVTLTVRDKVISSFGKLESIAIKRNFYYKIFIDKATFLPYQIIQSNSAAPDDYMLTTFSNISYNAPEPPELSWYYSTYLKDFKVVKEKQIEIIRAATKAPEFNLAYANSNYRLQLSSLKGNVVLLEFWIKNCGYCIAAVPQLNSLVSKFEKKKFRVVGVNVGDNKYDTEIFYKKNKPLFPSVAGGTKISEAYGVDGFPTIILVDKKGIVLYAGNADLEAIEPLIESHLK